MSSSNSTTGQNSSSNTNTINNHESDVPEAVNIAVKIIEALNFSKNFDPDVLENFRKLLNQTTSEKFINAMLADSTQIGLPKEIKKQKMQNDKETVVNNRSNSVMYPLGHYAQEIRNFNIHDDANKGGFPVEREEDAIANFQNINLKPTTTNDPSLDKQRSRKYTKYLFSIISTMNDSSKLHFIKETVCYILYQYLYNVHELNNAEFAAANCHLYFSDHLQDIGEFPQGGDYYVLNMANETEIAHAIRAILIANNTYDVSRGNIINIYVPTPYQYAFDFLTNREHQSRVITVTNQQLFASASSILNGVIPHQAYEGDEDNGIPAIDAVAPVLDAPTHPHRFVVNVQDLHAALSLISRSWGVLYFNGRCYDGNLQECNAATAQASLVNLVQSDVKLRIAYVHKFCSYVVEHDIVMFSSARLNNKLIWYTRRRFNEISEYVKRFIGSFCNNRAREELGDDYRVFLDMVELIGDQYWDVEMLFNNEKIKVNLISCCWCPVATNCALSNLDAYTRSNQYDEDHHCNRAAHWFGNELHRIEINAPNIPIQDHEINYEPNQDADNHPIYDNLILVEYCNCITNWNEDFFGSFSLSKNVEKYHYNHNSAKEWKFNKYYYLENGNVGSFSLYGFEGHQQFNIFAFANNLNFDCNAYCIPYLYEFEPDDETVTIDAKYYVKHQRYIDDDNHHLFHPSGDIVTGLFKKKMRKAFQI